jgi:serine/threonine-protein phosphatase 2A regulatory subunit B''
LSEEDKSTVTATEYWFHCLDIDGDELLSHFELKQFYDAQHRMTSDMPTFDDLMELLDDLIKTKRPPIITLSDLKKSNMGFLFLNAFINFKKFEAFDHRDPRQKESSFWVMFARAEYDRMANEDDIDDDAPTPVIKNKTF